MHTEWLLMKMHHDHNHQDSAIAATLSCSETVHLHPGSGSSTTAPPATTPSAVLRSSLPTSCTSAKARLSPAEKPKEAGDSRYSSQPSEVASSCVTTCVMTHEQAAKKNQLSRLYMCVEQLCVLSDRSKGMQDSR
jgi:hypothetical protein